ncbi:phosphatidylserine decarboxylase [Drepanopeziza brunnea f. sp. 'multigermtubi' MB_m1]|uniref:Phosphatidylserine decarboxylase proenzyme 1, mitochondrial n=1 Tax=Marssonina brunnea f. sp. multigermtubi (strain MB_m1) TaxID=1072389 RepID=K1X7T3_MARBU|nr:phosphatidylserine decarboxylase [Drepanopeziza brunnea f. sp. 'multigermtubi' MB_m1]EKD21111.1 phosphatidylserine decarboxylase [Drepanopeziza brunnea f. sp. 'multigermtubi' MB_m1]
MASQAAVRGARAGISAQSTRRTPSPPSQLQSQCMCPCRNPRAFSSSARPFRQQTDYKESFGTRLRKGLNDTKIKWYRIPVGLGIGFLGLGQLYRVHERENARRRKEEWEDNGVVKTFGSEGDKEGGGRPKKRERIRPTGPWQVQVMSTLPLKAMSRLWGKFNELEIPYYLRVPGFKLYSYIFGVNLSEVSEPDLHVYPNLASFFYRTLKPGARPLDPRQNALLSPADGRVLQFGAIESGEVEQVKGMTYSLDALLGKTTPGTSPNPSNSSAIFSPKSDASTASRRRGDEEIIKQDEEFASVNGISYTLPNLFSGKNKKSGKKAEDASTKSTASSEAEVRADLALGEKPWYSLLTSENRTSLYYVVVYLAPGDYHRFHSPCAWVAERRRHFAGELYSVSPYLQKTLPGLFTLNERVVLLGRWRWGFFSYTPVGATNVGSIKINFDRELRTNSLTTDTAADRAAEEAAKNGESYTGFAEATYEAASPILHGHALKRGEEMGGFQLGSTIVLVFEAPKGQRPSLDEGWMGEKTKRKGGWNWAVEKGQKVKMGQALGWVDES